MAEDDRPEEPGGDVEYSRLLPLSAMVALGSLASVGLGVYLLVGSIVSFMGNQTPLAYGLAVVFFFPIILVLGERAAVTRGSGGLFNLNRGGTGVGLQYWTGWLLFGGYLLLGAVFTWTAGSVLAAFKAWKLIVS